MESKLAHANKNTHSRDLSQNVAGPNPRRPVHPCKAVKWGGLGTGAYRTRRAKLIIISGHGPVHSTVSS